MAPVKPSAITSERQKILAIRIRNGRIVRLTNVKVLIGTVDRRSADSAGIELVTIVVPAPYAFLI